MSMNTDVKYYLKDFKTYSKSFENALNKSFDLFFLSRRKDSDAANENLIDHLSQTVYWYVGVFYELVDMLAVKERQKPRDYYDDVRPVLQQRKHKIIVPKSMSMLLFGLNEKDINKRIREFVFDNIALLYETEKHEKHEQDELIGYFLEFLDNI